MLLYGNFEFRGFTTATNSENTKTYTFFNVEDETGESCKILSDLKGENFKKGQKEIFKLDYSPRYSSLRIKDVKR